jgi:YfiH family protein
VTLRVVTVPAFAAIPGLVHGFERRASEAPPERREAFRARVTEALRPNGQLLLLKQVHGSTVVKAPWEGTPEADAAVATAAGILLGIATADCLPLLVVDPVRRMVGAAHAGWRGTAAGVATRLVESLLARGSRTGDLLAALGPSIGTCCYIVGEELRAAFPADADHVFRVGPDGRWFLDLREANARQLLRIGVHPDALHHVAECTCCRAGDYQSYRRDGTGAGRMISFIGFRRDE